VEMRRRVVFEVHGAGTGPVGPKFGGAVHTPVRRHIQDVGRTTTVGMAERPEIVVTITRCGIKFGCLARLLAATMSHVDGRPARSEIRSYESIVDKIVDYVTLTDKMAFKVGITRGWWT
jgi:hypothetical protein